MSPDQAESLRPRIAAFLRRILGAQSAVEDLESETLLVLLQKEREGKGPRDATRFALGVAFHLAQEWQRARNRHQKAERELTPKASIDPRTASALKEWIEIAMTDLDLEERALLHLRYSEELTEPEIARLLRRPRGSVARGLHAARRRLGQALRRHECGIEVAVALASLGRLGGNSTGLLLQASVAPKAAASLFGVFLAMKPLLYSALAAVLLTCAIAWNWMRAEDPTPPKAFSASSAEREASTSRAEAPTDAIENAEEALTTAPLEQSPFEAPLPGFRTLKGSVRTAEGTPIAGASIAVLRADDLKGLGDLHERIQSDALRAASNAKGEFAIKRPKAGRYHVIAQHPDYALWIDTPPLFTDELTIELMPPRIVRARAVDPEGQPIAGVQVTAQFQIDLLSYQSHSQSGADGVFEVQGFPTHSRKQLSLASRLWLQKSGFAPRRASFDIPIIRTETDEPPHEVVMNRGYSLHGQIRAEGRPLKDAEVAIWIYDGDGVGFSAVKIVQQGPRAASSRILFRTRSDENGQYEFRHLPTASPRKIVVGSQYRRIVAASGEVYSQVGGVVATHPDYAPLGAPLHAGELEGSQKRIDLNLERRRTLIGRFVDRDGKGIHGVRVALLPADQHWPMSPSRLDRSETISALSRAEGLFQPFGITVESDAEGHWTYAVPQTAEGTAPYFLRACACRLTKITNIPQRALTEEEWAGKRPILVTCPVQRLRLELKDEQGIPVIATRATILQIPSSTGSGEPVTSAHQLADSLTDRAGNLEIFVPPFEVPLRVAVKVAGFATAEGEFAPGKPELNLSLTPSCPLEGVVRTRTGVPLPKLKLVLMGADTTEAPLHMPTDDEGRFRFDRTPKAPFRLYGIPEFADRDEAQWQLLQAFPAPTTELIELIAVEPLLPRTRGRLEVQLQYEAPSDQSQPTKIEATLMSTSYQWQARILSAASAAFEDLPHGDYLIEVQWRDRPAMKTQLRLEGLAQLLTLQVQAGSEIHGHLLISEGEEFVYAPNILLLDERYGQVLIQPASIDGAFRTRGLKPGKYWLKAFAHTNVQRGEGLITPRLTAIDLAAGESLGPISLRLLPRKRVTIAIEGLSSAGIKEEEILAWRMTPTTQEEPVISPLGLDETRRLLGREIALEPSLAFLDLCQESGRLELLSGERVLGAVEWRGERKVTLRIQP